VTALAHTIVEADQSTTIIETVDGHTVVETEEGTIIEVTELVLPDQGYVTSNVVDSIVTLTQAEYDLIVAPDPRVLYVIIG
jgi:hypothetical protein